MARVGRVRAELLREGFKEVISWGGRFWPGRRLWQSVGSHCIILSRGMSRSDFSLQRDDSGCEVEDCL